MTKLWYRVRKMAAAIREAGREVQRTEAQLCWACGLSRCGDGVFINSCPCCRVNHLIP